MNHRARLFLLVCVLCLAALSAWLGRSSDPAEPAAGVDETRTPTESASFGSTAVSSDATPSNDVHQPSVETAHEEAGAEPLEETGEERARPDAMRAEEDDAPVRHIRLAGSPSPDEPEPREHRESTFEETDAQAKRHGLSREGIREAIASVRDEVRDCYEPWLQMDDTIEGRIVLDITVESSDEPADDGRFDGLVTNVGIDDSELDHTLVEGCIGNVIGGLRFEEPRDGVVRIRYPFVFRARPSE